MTVLNGRLLQQAFATVQDKSWGDAPAWDDFDPDQQAYWDQAAAWLAEKLKAVPDVPDVPDDPSKDPFQAALDNLGGLVLILEDGYPVTVKNPLSLAATLRLVLSAAYPDPDAQAAAPAKSAP